MEIADHITTGSRVIAAQVRYFRELRGMTQQQLGDACGMKQESISRLENTDDVHWTTTTLLTIAAALDMAVMARLVGSDTQDHMGTKD